MAPHQTKVVGGSFGFRNVDIGIVTSPISVPCFLPILKIHGGRR
jgi:hypothetical protein